MTGLSVVVPAYNEGPAVVPVLRALAGALQDPDAEVLVVVDDESDTTRRPVDDVARDDPRFRSVVSSYGRGPANAIRFGIDVAAGDVIVVTMADGSDEVGLIPELRRLVEDGAVVAAASRYMPGGRQVGGPRVKALLSRVAGVTLHRFAGVGTHDATNAFKAYDAAFVRRVGIDSRDGFEMALELTAKATRLGLPVVETPAVWRDRTAGRSRFRLRAWVPRYLRWYRFAFGPRLDVDELLSVTRGWSTA